MAIITGPSDSVPVSAEVRYAEVVLDAGTSVGSTAAISYAPVEAQSTGYVPYAEFCTDVASDVAVPIPEVNISTVAGSSVGSSAPVPGPPGLLDSGTDLVKVGLVMRDLFDDAVLGVPTCAGTSLSCLLLRHLVRNVVSINKH